MNDFEPSHVLSFTTMPRVLFVSLFLFSLSGSASQAFAQDAPSAAQARARATQASTCLSAVNRRAERYVALLLDARQQLSSSNEQVRSDAAQAIVSLEQSIANLANEMRACVPNAAQLRTEEVEESLEPDEQHVAEAGDATPNVEENTNLSSRVRVRVGERVDGMGQVDHDALRSALRRASGTIDRCFESARPGAEALVAFSVAPTGYVRRVSVEYVQNAPSNLAGCVSRAMRSMRVRPGAHGGDVRFSYHFVRR